MCPKSIRNYEKNNTWNIRRLVGGSLGQTNKRPIVIYIRSIQFKPLTVLIATSLQKLVGF